MLSNFGLPENFISVQELEVSTQTYILLQFQGILDTSYIFFTGYPRLEFISWIYPTYSSHDILDILVYILDTSYILFTIYPRYTRVYNLDIS